MTSCRYVFVVSHLVDFIITCSWCGWPTSSESFLTCLWTCLVVYLHVKVLWMSGRQCQLLYWCAKYEVITEMDIPDHSEMLLHVLCFMYVCMYVCGFAYMAITWLTLKQNLRCVLTTCSILCLYHSFSSMPPYGNVGNMVQDAAALLC